MVLSFVRNDITKMNVECIVNAANSTLLGGNGVDGAIHKVAGPKLLKECMTLGGCKVGDAKITKGYNLKAKYVIHTVGPAYKDGKHKEKELLESCYIKSLQLAKEYKIKSIAFPLISSGTLGYPKNKALSVAVDTIRSFYKDEDDDIKVFIVIFDKDSFDIGKRRYNAIQEFIDDVYVEKNITSTIRSHVGDSRSIKIEKGDEERKKIFDEILKGIEIPKSDRKNKKYSANKMKIVSLKGGSGGKKEKVAVTKKTYKPKNAKKSAVIKEVTYSDIGREKNRVAKKKERKESNNKIQNVGSITDALRDMDCSFSEALFKMIDMKGYNDVDVYRRANIDRKLFSKIKKDDHYHPKKETAVAFCIALKLDVKESNDLLSKAGYILSNSEKFDVIVLYHIKNNKYNIDEINEVLFQYDLTLLGTSK